MIGGGAQKITVEIGGKIAASLGASLRTAQMQVSSFGRNVNRTMNDAALAGRKSFKGMFDNALWQQAAVGAAGIGVAFGASIRQAARFEVILSDIGKTANIGQGELKALSGELLRLSGRNLTNLSPEKLAAGIQDLVAQGLELKDAVASMESLGKVATATNSDLLDVTKTGFQLQNALKIRPTELKATFDALAFAGKQGAFELRDMAQFMPTIAAAAGSLGIQGQKGAVSLAAMMQMVRKDAPDAGQAATRLTDAMLKLTAPDAVKRFSKFGVNIEQVLNDAKAKGINPMEAALDQLQKVTGGDIFKLSQIFGDKEAKLALMSLMKYRKEYEKLKADAGGSAAAGTVDKDFQRSLATFQGTLTSFQNSAQRLGIAVGNALLPPLTRMAEIITPIAEGIASWVAANPGLATGITVIGAGLAGLVVALPVIAGVVSAIGTIGTAIGAAAAAFPVIAGIGTVLAVAAGPISLVVAGIIGIGAAFTFAYHKVEWFRAGVDSMVPEDPGRVRADDRWCPGHVQLLVRLDDLAVPAADHPADPRLCPLRPRHPGDHLPHPRHDHRPVHQVRHRPANYRHDHRRAEGPGRCAVLLGRRRGLPHRLDDRRRWRWRGLRRRRSGHATRASGGRLSARGVPLRRRGAPPGAVRARLQRGDHPPHRPAHHRRCHGGPALRRPWRCAGRCPCCPAGCSGARLAAGATGTPSLGAPHHQRPGHHPRRRQRRCYGDQPPGAARLR